jgi:hypothetical protein
MNNTRVRIGFFSNALCMIRDVRDNLAFGEASRKRTLKRVEQQIKEYRMKALA